MKTHLAVEARQCGACTACCTLLAVVELGKPMRWACDHVDCAGCRVYDARPQSCRQFECLWLRGEIGVDESSRPDHLGIMFDGFTSQKTNKPRFVALEVWNGAFDEPAGSAILHEAARSREVELSYRDGSWRTVGPAVPRSAAPRR